jgi:hypothetical protein
MAGRSGDDLPKSAAQGNERKSSRPAARHGEEDIQMKTKQGDLSLLDHPVARELLQSKIPARLAYSWPDGSPRVVPIWFHWNGKELVVGSPMKAPKLKALRTKSKVAVSIDTDTRPYHVLQIRGTAQTETVEGVSPEYEAAAKRYLGDEAARALVNQLRGMSTHMARISVKPEWVAVIDFETRFPSAMAG